MHWGRVGAKCTIFLCFVSLKISNVGNRSLGRSKALAVRADGRFRHLGKADVASGANDGAIGAADVVVEGQDELGHAGGIGEWRMPIYNLGYKSKTPSKFAKILIRPFFFKFLTHRNLT